MRAGQLRTRVTIQSRSQSDDGQAGTTNTWVDVVTVWGAVSSKGGREFQTAKQTRATLTDEVRIRYRSDIAANMRVVVLGGPVLSIVAPPIDVDRRHRELILLCETIEGEAE